MHLTIAMTTCNGERFLQQQLDSFASQTRPPDELVVCDDRSSDQTPLILQRFAHSAAFPVRLYLNDQNLGVRRNFEKAISLSTGDIILLSDQDDIWAPQKLSLFENAFTHSPDVGLVFCDANVVDHAANPLGYTFWQRLGFNPKQQNLFHQGLAFNVFVKHCFVAGATLAFRSSFRSIILPIGQYWLYDAWIATTISAIAQTRLLPQPLNHYRQHPQQTMGGGRRPGLWQTYRDAKRKVDAQFFADREKEFRELRDRLLLTASLRISDNVFDLLDDKIALCHARSLMRKNPWLRWPRVARELLSGHYHRCAHGWRTAALDLFV